MDITIAIREYKKEGNFFAPDYEQENEILNKFKDDHPTISKFEIETFNKILTTSNDWEEKFFVADLLYLYPTFDIILLDPLIENAISYSDPSFNRIFLRPCITVFGVQLVSDILADKFSSSDIVTKINISSLVYWLERNDNHEISNLEDVIVDRSNKTDNIIELYHYNRYFPDKVGLSKKIPQDAEELIRCIKDNNKLEDLLFNKLGWRQMKGG
jgi:hypothetical protein